MSTAHQPHIAPPTISPASAGVLMTPAEFDAIDDWDDDYRYELINEVLIVTPPPSEGERGPNELLAHLLRAHQDQHGVAGGLDYTLPEQTVVTATSRRRADRVIWAGLGRTPRVRHDPPTIVIEFVSRDRRDRERDYQAKREEYATAGVREYWIIDRFRRRAVIVAYAKGAQQERIVDEKGELTSPLLPQLAIPLARLFAEAEMLEQAAAEDRVVADDRVAADDREGTAG